MSPARSADIAPNSTDAGARAECSPCRGSGQVISNLGGTPSTVACPWCEGSGQFLAGHDAQTAQRALIASA
jgi:DnaJ-class molecular chaperone